MWTQKQEGHLGLLSIRMSSLTRPTMVLILLLGSWSPSRISFHSSLMPTSTRYTWLNYLLPDKNIYFDFELLVQYCQFHILLGVFILTDPEYWVNTCLVSSYLGVYIVITFLKLTQLIYVLLTEVGWSCCCWSNRRAWYPLPPWETGN